MTLDPRDVRVVGLQLGREPRAIRDVAHRCGCGLPDVVETNPRLEDGTPFPTLYYLTCPRAASLIGQLESSGLMKEMTARLATDPELQARYDEAARDYVRRRDAHEVLENVPAQGGMPTRVKCLHVLVGHSLAVGQGVNPFGDEALAMLEDWSRKGPCVDPDSDDMPHKKTRS
ncbi:MAG: hypothetical protein JWL79_3410 [Frankiales bacterium]|nr:hypothetical protein [Frankiales bacterium]